MSSISDYDIMKYNCDNSDISEISKIIALLFHLCDLYHYYCYSGVGPGALLQTPERTHYITIMRVYFSLFTTKNGVSLYAIMTCCFSLR